MFYSTVGRVIYIQFCRMTDINLHLYVSLVISFSEFKFDAKSQLKFNFQLQTLIFLSKLMICM